ncbi:hypothetical protein B0H10DRAFT_2014392, partial [Mycena sp. CBHHK59/15]
TRGSRSRFGKLLNLNRRFGSAFSQLLSRLNPEPEPEPEARISDNLPASMYVFVHSFIGH